MKHIVVTGGSHGIGQGIVEAYLKQGWKVTNLDKQGHDAFESYETYQHVQCDLSDHAHLQKQLSSLSHVDAIVLNASATDSNPFSKQTIDEWKRIVDVNLIANMAIAQQYYNQYNGHHGRIVLIASTRAFMSEPNTVGYSVSKGGLVSLTHSLAMTMQDKHITVNAIAPGWIQTSDYSISNEEHQFHPSKRVGKVEDIVRAVQFIIEEDSTFINGDVLTIDGGVTKKMIYPE